MARKKKARVLRPNPEYQLPERSGLKDDTIRVLSFDPGIRNFGISVVAARGSAIKVIANSIVTSPMNDMTLYNEQMEAYLTEITRWVTLYKPHALIAERFMLRGAGTGMAMGELVPSMIAAAKVKFGLKTKTIPAAQWKVPLQRRFNFDLKQLYKQCMTEAHPLDSAFIGIYGLEFGLNRKFEFTPEQIMLQVEDTSLLPLKQRRGR